MYVYGYKMNLATDYKEFIKALIFWSTLKLALPQEREIEINISQTVTDAINWQ